MTATSTPEPVTIELPPAQVDHIVRTVADTGTISALLSGLTSVRDTLEGGSHLTDKKLSRSLLTGLLMLAAVPADGSEIANVELARILGINHSTSHRYVLTLVVAGLLERNPTTRRYRLVQ